MTSVRVSGSDHGDRKRRSNGEIKDRKSLRTWKSHKRKHDPLGCSDYSETEHESLLGRSETGHR